MPCRDWTVDEAPLERRLHGMTIEDFEATLCGLFTLFEKEGEIDWWTSRVDWKEAGVKRKTVETWWKKHKEEDAARRAREAAERRKEELKAHALSKLSAEERAALGI